MKKRKDRYGSAGWKTAMKKLKGVDAMFEVREKDKRLPSFGEFFIACLLTGNAERVNLKAMFSKHHKAQKLISVKGIFLPGFKIRLD